MFETSARLFLLEGILLSGGMSFAKASSKSKILSLRIFYTLSS